MEIVDYLLPRPMLVMETGVDNQTNRSQHVILQMPIVAVRILEKSDFLAQSLRVEGPSFRVGCIKFVLTKQRQFRQLLRDGNLHVMSRESFVIGGGLDIQHGALGEIAGVHHDVAGPRTVSSAIHVFGVRCFLLAKSFHRPHLELRLRQSSKQLRQSRVHLVFVLTVQIEDLLSRLCVQLRIRIHCSFEALHILKSKLMDNREHSGFDLFHLIETHLMNYLGRQICSRTLFHSEGIPRCPVWQRPCPRLDSALRRVLVAQERR